MPAGPERRQLDVPRQLDDPAAQRLEQGDRLICLCANSRGRGVHWRTRVEQLDASLASSLVLGGLERALGITVGRAWRKRHHDPSVVSEQFEQLAQGPESGGHAEHDEEDDSLDTSDAALLGAGRFDGRRFGPRVVLVTACSVGGPWLRW